MRRQPVAVFPGRNPIPVRRVGRWYELPHDPDHRVQYMSDVRRYVEAAGGRIDYADRPARPRSSAPRLPAFEAMMSDVTGTPSRGHQAHK